MAVLSSRAQERRSREVRARSARERAAKPREKSSDLICSLNLSYTKQKSMENYAVRLSSTVCDSSTTIADTVRCIAPECVIL